MKQSCKTKSKEKPWSWLSSQPCHCGFTPLTLGGSCSQQASNPVLRSQCPNVFETDFPFSRSQYIANDFSSIYPTRLGFLSVNSLGNMLIYKLEVKQEWEIVGSLPLGAWVVTVPSRRKWCSPDFSCIGTITKRLFLNLVTVSDLRPLKQSLIWGKQMSHLEKYIKWSTCGRSELRKESWKENWQNTSVSITWNRSILGSWYFRWMTHPSRHPSALGHQHRPQCSSSYHTSLIPHSSNFALHFSILRWCSILCSQ